MQKLIALLEKKDKKEEEEDSEETKQALKDLRVDVKQTLKNISELPDGFLVIASKLAHNIEYLKEVFFVPI